MKAGRIGDPPRNAGWWGEEVRSVHGAGAGIGGTEEAER